MTFLWCSVWLFHDSIPQGVDYRGRPTDVYQKQKKRPHTETDKHLVWSTDKHYTQHIEEEENNNWESWKCAFEEGRRGRDVPRRQRQLIAINRLPRQEKRFSTFFLFIHVHATTRFIHFIAPITPRVRVPSAPAHRTRTAVCILSAGCLSILTGGVQKHPAVNPSMAMAHDILLLLSRSKCLNYAARWCSVQFDTHFNSCCCCWFLYFIASTGRVKEICAWPIELSTEERRTGTGTERIAISVCLCPYKR